MSFMKDAIEEAKKAASIGEIPVGAVIVKDGKIIARGHNLKETLKSPIEHAEIRAIEEACKVIGDWRLTGCEMYVTLEPCAMCTAAICQSRISKLHIGSFNKDMGACGSVINLIDMPSIQHFTRVKWCYDDECSRIISSFFDKRRKSSSKLNESKVDR